jgi:hypothetical protein
VDDNRHHLHDLILPCGDTCRLPLDSSIRNPANGTTSADNALANPVAKLSYEEWKNRGQRRGGRGRKRAEINAEASPP